MIKKIILTDIEFEKGKTILIDEPNKMWDDDVATTSSRLSWKRDGERVGYASFVKADNLEDALKEVIPKVQLQEFFEESFSFKELGLSEPCFESEDGELGTIGSVDVFLGERKRLHIKDEDSVLESLVSVASDLFPVEVIF